MAGQGYECFFKSRNISNSGERNGTEVDGTQSRDRHMIR